MVVFYVKSTNCTQMTKLVLEAKIIGPIIPHQNRHHQNIYARFNLQFYYLPLEKWGTINMVILI